MFTIRKAKPEDAIGIQRVFYKTWLATYPNAEHGITVDDIEHRYEGYDSPERTEKTAQRIKNLPENEIFLVASISGTVIGVCRAAKEKDKNFLRALYVLPEYQGKGVGTAFMSELEKFFDPSLPSRVDVAIYNLRAIAFYEKFGFKRTGRTFSEERFRMKSGSMLIEEEMAKEPQGK